MRAMTAALARWWRRKIIEERPLAQPSGSEAPVYPGVMPQDPHPVAQDQEAQAELERAKLAEMRLYMAP